MLILDDIRKCVVFIALRMDDGSFRFVGSAFFMGKDKPGADRADLSYLVTAKHVIDGIRSTGVEKVWLRINLKSGGSAWGESHIDEWFSHPTNTSLDVAVLKMGTQEEFDHLLFPYSYGISAEKIKENELGLGDEVFITGLFKHHKGMKRNIPIVRVGNLACMDEEKVSTKLFGEIEAYLIESRSIGGLSGSPVFLNLGLVRRIGPKVQLATEHTAPAYLLGLIHGHYDSMDRTIDSEGVLDEGNDADSRINTGIAIVVPFHNIDEVINEFEKKSPAS